MSQKPLLDCFGKPFPKKLLEDEPKPLQDLYDELLYRHFVGDDNARGWFARKHMMSGEEEAKVNSIRGVARVRGLVMPSDMGVMRYD